MLGVEPGQRWRCRSYNPRNNVIVPYSSTESINSVPLKQGHEKETLLYFRQAPLRDLSGLSDQPSTITASSAAERRVWSCMERQEGQNEQRHNEKACYDVLLPLSAPKSSVC